MYKTQPVHLLLGGTNKNPTAIQTHTKNTKALTHTCSQTQSHSCTSNSECEWRSLNMQASARQINRVIIRCTYTLHFKAVIKLINVTRLWLRNANYWIVRMSGFKLACSFTRLKGPVLIRKPRACGSTTLINPCSKETPHIHPKSWTKAMASWHAFYTNISTYYTRLVCNYFLSQP